jgi:hypothetical protein
MNTLFTIRRSAWAHGITAAAVLVSSGCASPPPTPDKLVAVPMGTVTTFHRKSSGSLGAYDGKVVWTHSPATWQGQAVISFTAPQAGGALHEPASFGMVASLGNDGKPQMSYEPPVNYPWPLVVGKTWSTTHTVTLLATGRTLQLKVDGKVESLGDITVPAGTYKAYRLAWVNNLGETETRWVSPEDGLATVKRHVERPATHPQGAGVLDAELLSRALPAR